MNRHSPGTVEGRFDMTTAFQHRPDWKRRIVLFLASQNISLFGSSVVGYAIIWYITLETSSGFWIMLSTICNTLPQIVISLWGGVWADRHNRKYLIMLADAFIALATLVLAIAFLLGFRRMELILAVSAVRSIGAGVQSPAVNAIYPQLVPADQLTRIQGINQTLGSVLQLVAPAAGGVILGTMGIVWTFLVDVTTASIAIAVMSFIQVEKLAQAEARASMLAELREGLRYAFSHPLIRRSIICFACTFFLFTPAAVLAPLMVERSFGGDVWRLTMSELAWSLGSILGGVYISTRSDIKNKVRAVALCVVAFGVCFGLLGVVPGFASFLVLMGIAGVFMPIAATSQIVLIQEITEPTIMGRVFSIISIISAGAMPLAIILFGPLADIVSVESIMLVSGILLVLVGILYQ